MRLTINEREVVLLLEEPVARWVAMNQHPADVGRIVPRGEVESTAKLSTENEVWVILSCLDENKLLLSWL